ncbi:hypothetical protein OUZ56_020884 [Daphnia magna]|uniref:Metalloendopeptidase n=1 Tax=Daphnia magna TaxID=35525 RepID=A0ABQ9ZFQ7_9CRUS|nr:hypothetical protein OUZ56_020884 [Daphnia magna]
MMAVTLFKVLAVSAMASVRLGFVSIFPAKSTSTNTTEIDIQDDFETGKPFTEEELESSGVGKEDYELNEVSEQDGQHVQCGNDITLMGRKNLLLISSHRWPNAQIPYVISASYTPIQREIIASAIKAYHTHTCIRFVARTTERNYVRISKTGQGCWGDVGMIGGRQKVSLDDHCVLYSRPGLVMHELMHVLGFYHEHQRPDRDKYVSINFDNIERKNRDYFQKVKMWDLKAARFSYDYGSLMHYPSDAFAKDPTIPVIQPLHGKPVLGQRKTLSALDVKKLNRFYCKASGLYGFTGEQLAVHIKNIRFR